MTIPALSPDTSIPLPAHFFTEILPAISDLCELKVTLALYYRAATGTSLVAEAELLADPALRRGLLPLGSARDPADEVGRGLELALSRGTLLALETREPDRTQRWYALATPAGRELVAAIEAGRRPRPSSAGAAASPLVAARTNIFRLYERHIAVLTPLIAQQLAEAAEQYPAAWISDAFDEAVARDRRSWRFIHHLLERWASEGRQDATYRRVAARPLDPNKYTKGKYAPFFRRSAPARG